LFCIIRLGLLLSQPPSEITNKRSVGGKDWIERIYTCYKIAKCTQIYNIHYITNSTRIIGYRLIQHLWQFVIDYVVSHPSEGELKVKKAILFPTWEKGRGVNDGTNTNYVNSDKLWNEECAIITFKKWGFEWTKKMNSTGSNASMK